MGPGHGRGMSQFGALERANQGWGAENILAHYYPGASLGTIGATPVTVWLSRHPNDELQVRADRGLTAGGKWVSAGRVARLRPGGNGGGQLEVTDGCGGPVLSRAQVPDTWVVPADPRPGRPASEHLTLCDGGKYRGALGLVSGGGSSHLVNRVNVEDYVRGVVPAEESASWSDTGGQAALQAQAIAARSYGLAEHRWPYAQTCDTTDCQMYPGTASEDLRSNQAVAATAGTVLLRDGRILRSEYSGAPDGPSVTDIQTFAVGPSVSELAPDNPPPPARAESPDVSAAAPEAPSGSPGVSPPPPEVATQVPEKTQVPDNNPDAVQSPIDVEYQRLGGPSSALGKPLGREVPLPDRNGSYRIFAHGVMVSTPQLGARVIDFTTLRAMVPGLVTE